MSKVEDTSNFERVLTVKIDEEAIDAAKKTAARRLSAEMKIKGFRPGKAPLKVVESAVGAATLRREAIDDALPKVLTAALEEAELEPVVSPRLTDIRDDEDGVEVQVLLTLWPTLDRLPMYEGRRVQLDAPPVDDEAVEEQIERMRDQFADLEDVDREAFDGDFVIIDVTTAKGSEDFAAGSATDMLFEVGSGMFLEGMDDALRGKAAGHIAQFSTTLPPSFGEDGGAEVSVRVLVKQVKAKRLPELTDEWVDDMTEFETVDEMRRELAVQMKRIRRASLRSEFERILLQELVEDADLDLPAGLVDAEMDSVFHRFAHRLEQQGIELGEYLALTGQDEASFVGDLRAQAEVNLKTRVLLEAVATAEGIEVEESELDEVIEQLAEASDMEASEYRQALAEGAQELALSSDILRRKAVDRLLELAVPVDGSGSEIDLEIEELAPRGEADSVEAGVEDGAEMRPTDASGDEASAGPDDDGQNVTAAETEQNRPTSNGWTPAEVDE